MTGNGGEGMNGLWDTVDADRPGLQWLSAGLIHELSDQQPILGSDGDDQLFGGTGDDTLRGRGGDDLVWGEDGHDRLNGGGGNDSLHGAAGNDVLHGGRGNDLLDGGDGDDALYGGPGSDWLDGGPNGWTQAEGNGGDDTLIVQRGGVASGGGGDDLLAASIAGAAHAVLAGDGGNDIYSIGAVRDGWFGVADLMWGAGDRLHLQLGDVNGNPVDPRGAFAALDTNGDLVVDGADPASGYGVATSDGVSTLWLWLADGAGGYSGVVAVHGARELTADQLF